MAEIGEAVRFARCVEIVLTHEGGYVDHPADPGGATNMGITRKTLAQWRKVSPWWALDKAEVRALKRSEAEDIYRKSYWTLCGADRLPPGLDLAIFDFAVNSGPSRAVKALQKLVGTKADGLFGPLTLAAVGEAAREDHAHKLVSAVCDARLGFLKALSTFPVFGTGWTRRVATTRAKALAMVETAQSSSQPQENDLAALQGYRTYLIALAMLVAGLCQIAGVDLPTLDGHSAGQMIMEGLAIIFLRKGIQTEIGKA